MSSKCMLFVKSNFEILCALHTNVRAKKKRRKTSFVKANHQWSCYTLSQTYESRVTLSTLYFKRANDYPCRISSHQYPVTTK